MSTVKELKALAEERGVDLSGLKRKADIEAALEAADVGDVPAEAAPTPAASNFDVVGEDGRRVVRGYAESACGELVRRIRENGSEEELTIVPSPEA